MSGSEQEKKAAVRRVVFASLIGATIEWYDFFLYGVVAGIVFNKLYFPTSDPLVSTMLAYCVFRLKKATIPAGKRPAFRREKGQHSDSIAASIPAKKARA